MTPTHTETNLSPWWRNSLLLLMIAGFSVLIGIAVATYHNAPPIPDYFGITRPSVSVAVRRGGEVARRENLELISNSVPQWFLREILREVAACLWRLMMRRS